MKKNKKIPVFHCTCCAEFLIVPDLSAMNESNKEPLGST
jgi:hypothetical protein